MKPMTSRVPWTGKKMSHFHRVVPLIAKQAAIEVAQNSYVDRLYVKVRACGPILRGQDVAVQESGFACCFGWKTRWNRQVKSSR